MRTISFRSKRLVLPVIFIALITIISCKKDKESLDAMRMFSPAGKISISAGELEAKLTWNASLYSLGKDVKYTVEISKDSLFAAGPEYSAVTDTSGIIITDQNIEIRKKYYARIKTNESGDSQESKWIASSGFTLTGLQIFYAINDGDIKDKSVILKWRVTPGVNKIVITQEGGATSEISVSAEEAAAGQKKLSGLSPVTAYSVLIYSTTKVEYIGVTSFKTKELSLYTVILTPSDDLLVAVNAAADGDVIGLQPGIYTVSESGTPANLTILQKNITIESVSKNPSDTKVNFKEVTLAGNGAGISLKGIDFDGAASSAAYFLNLVGAVGDATANGLPATFKSITVDNSIVHNVTNCFIRADRGTNAGDHKIDLIKVNNSKISDSSIGSSYVFFTISKLAFNRMELLSSTFFNMGRAFINSSTVLPAKPSVLINQCTINNFGSGGTSRNYPIFDANTNPIDLTIQNSIIANTPISGQMIGNNALRANGSGSVMTFSNNNTFNLTNGASTPAALIFPTMSGAGNKTINLGWTGSTTDFTLPVGSELRTSGSGGIPVGDPRWAN